MDIDNLEGRVPYREEDIQDILGQLEELESAYLLGIQDETYHISVEQVVETYDLGTVDSGRGYSNPFDLKQTVLERVDFARVELGEIRFERAYLKQTESRVNLGKVTLEKVLAYMGC